MNNKNKSQTDINSILRDKMITTSLNNTLKQNDFIPQLSKLGGIEYLKKSVETLIYNPLMKKQEYINLGQSPPMTLLLHGTSGVGKTFLIHSISQEYQIPIIIGNCENEKEIRETFRKGDITDKSIILFDNLDSLNEEDNFKSIKQLSENLNNYRGKSLIVGIVENIVKLPKLIQRFDNELLIKIPNIDERKEMCKFFSEKISHKIDDWSIVAEMTPGCTPRDLKKLFKIAGSATVAENRTFIEISDFEKSIKEIKKQNGHVTFDNIGSLDEVKEELKMSIIYPSKYPEKFQRMGINKPSGVLLYGPPGCGKTLLAKAVSNMSHCNFISVRGPELISKFVGDSEKEIRDLFGRAKQLQPCVIFFDEIDSLCQKRNNNDFCNRIVNQILTLLDGLEDRGDVYLIGATNRIEILDKALLRPGRFDKIIEVPLPSQQGCIDIFKKCVKDIPIEDFDYSSLPLCGLSGAEISGIAKEAALICLKNNFENIDMKITQENVIEAINKYRTSRNK
ncbi:transitional endoplasmic reticulum ATPase CDC48-like protein [Vairimorpha necatrix]|uniref:Transitional endoplasmic reticulum ATPase CDC48-like protein n=1 Tax=Vairimorpha necatrix TaxID=6039 RepID=A0AAX4JCG5_9MICR